ncbi:MAG: hypothetical protein JW974_03640 [Alphaproteobacteria bacterium]|nr:hypothetical protein [Alphaproteobacteria bacterium]
MAKTLITSVNQFETEWAKVFRTNFDSSAKQLNEILLENNIFPSIKIFYEYKLPNNFSPQEFEKEIKKIWGHLIFDTNSVTIYFDIDKKTLNELEKQRSKHTDILTSWVNNIKNNNPELSNISVKTQDNALALVDGACYGFTPEDIEFFINKQTYKSDKKDYKIEEKKDELEKLLGKTPSFVLSSERLDTLIDSVKKQKRFNDYIEWRQSRGMEDE